MTTHPAIDIHALLAERRQIAHVWGVEDVERVRPDLTDDQAWEVLQGIDISSELGLTWDTLHDAADEMFPEGGAAAA